MSGTDVPDLSSCVLCGRPVDDGGVARSFGGVESRVHETCAREGLEGKELASSHATPEEDGSGTGETGPGDEPPASEGSEPAAEPGPEASAGPAEDEATREASPEANREADPDRSRDDAGKDGNGGSPGQAREASSGGGRGGDDPDWTRISDFT